MDTKFAYWVPNVSGGLVIIDWPMKTYWKWPCNKKIAQTAEENGFDALAQARFFGSYNAEKQLEALSVANALASHTETLRLIGTMHPGQWKLGPIANFAATADHISDGRVHLNVVSGWFKRKYTRFGEPWLAHDERYERSEEFIRVLKGLWTEDLFSFDGRFNQIDQAPCEPKPATPPDIFQGGNSQRARHLAARVSDWFFINGGSLEKLKGTIDDVKGYPGEFGTEPFKIGVNSFVIARDAEAQQVLEKTIEHATEEAVEDFEEQVKQAGQSSPEGEDMWDDFEFEDSVQYNDGFKTGLIGTKEKS